MTIQNKNRKRNACGCGCESCCASWTSWTVFVIVSFFVLWAGRASGSGSSVPYSLPFSIPIRSNVNFFAYIHQPRSGRWRRGVIIDISNTLLPGCSALPRLLPDMNKIDCRSSDRGERVREFSSSSKSQESSSTRRIVA